MTVENKQKKGKPEHSWFSTSLLIVCFLMIIMLFIAPTATAFIVFSSSILIFIFSMLYKL